MGFYAPHVLVNDGKRHGVSVLPPDINLSGANCSVEEMANGKGEMGPGHVDEKLSPFPFPLSTNLAVRIGLRYIRGMSEKKGAKDIEEERRRAGDYRSLFDFLERTRIKREAVENLIACGAFDAFGLERRELVWQLGLVYRPEGRNVSEQRQLSLPLPTEQDMVALAPMTDWERMRTDYLVLGLSPRYHPMSFLRPNLHEGVVVSKMVESLPDGKQIEMAGLVVCRQQPGTAKGFVFMVLEDEFGLVNVIVKPDLYEKQRVIVRGEPFVIAKGEVQRRDGVTRDQPDG
jgi:error-prone DNA polymerase